MTDKNSFVLYTNYLEQLELLTDAEKGQLFMAIMRHANKEDAGELTGAVKMAFSFIRAQMDRDCEKYNNTVEKRRQAGAQGGRPKTTEEKQNEAKKANGFSEKQNEAKKPDNENDNVNVNDNVNDSLRESNNNAREAHTPSQAPQKHKHGQYGWVKLTDKEYNQLILEFGKDKADRFIDVVDEYTESNGNKNKYKGWNVVVRKAIRENWGGAPEPKNRGKPYEPPEYDGEFDFLEHVGER